MVKFLVVAIVLIATTVGCADAVYKAPVDHEQRVARIKAAKAKKEAEAEKAKADRIAREAALAKLGAQKYANHDDTQYMQAALEGVKAGLKDPYSAKFTAQKILQDGEFRIVCGLVNAKNTYGGYTGKKIFKWQNGALTIQRRSTKRKSIDRYIEEMEILDQLKSCT